MRTIAAADIRGPNRAGSRWRPIRLAALWAFASGLIGMMLTDVGPWYEALRKPSWNPPNWLFGPAWTTIFLLSAIAFVKSWRAGPAEARPALLAVYVANGTLNAVWSLLFFAWRRPDWALWETIPLTASITAMMLVAGRHSRPAAWLLLPYLLWVLFATFLNWSIVGMNPRFGG